MRGVRLFHSGKRIHQLFSVDYIGNNIGTRNVAVIEKINEAIENVVGSKDESVNVIKDALKLEERCGIANILLTFELLKTGDVTQFVKIERQLAKLNDLSQNGILWQFFHEFVEFTFNCLHRAVRYS
jgi:hypothetical protein